MFSKKMLVVAVCTVLVLMQQVGFVAAMLPNGFVKTNCFYQTATAEAYYRYNPITLENGELEKADVVFYRLDETGNRVELQRREAVTTGNGEAISTFRPSSCGPGLIATLEVDGVVIAQTDVVSNIE